MKEKLQKIWQEAKSKWQQFPLKEYILKIIKICRKIYGYICNKINIGGTYIGQMGISANIVSWVGFIIGVFAINFIAMEMYGWALLAILLNRICDGLDGAVARSTKITDFGIFLDATLDYIFYGGVIFAFALANPSSNAIAAACMLFGFASAGCAMLAYSVIAYKEHSTHQINLDYSPFYLGGIAQGSETLVAFVLLCIFPQWFSVLGILFGVFSLIKCFSLIAAAYYNFVIVPFRKGNK